MTAIIDDIKLKPVVNKVITAPDKKTVEPITDQDIEETSSGYFAILKQCIYNDLVTNFDGLFTDEECSTEYSTDNYTLNVSSAVIQFTTFPPTLYARYLPGGSIIWAEHINNLQDAVKAIDNNTIYKDGSVAMTGNLDMAGRNIVNANTINNINLSTHKHLGLDVDGTSQIDDDSIISLSMSKVTGLQDALDSKQNNLPTYQSGKFLTNNGSNLSWGFPYTRNIGEVIPSLLPLTDSKLHLLDGSSLSGIGTYSELYNYLLNNSTVTQYASSVNIVGNLQNSNNVLSGFSGSDYAQIPLTFGSVNHEDWEIQLKFKYKEPTNSGYQDLLSPEFSDSAFKLYIYLYSTILPSYNKNEYFTVAITVMSSSGSLVTSNIGVSLPSNYLVDGNNYWMKCKYSNSGGFTISLSSDGVTFDVTRTVGLPPNARFPVYKKSFLNLGINTEASTISPWLGSIDLNGCYIKLDNAMLWQGGMIYNKPTADFLIDEGLWQSIQEKYGSCGKFVLDTLNKVSRLPKIDNILQGTSTVSHVGNLVEAGLPNITGSPILGEASSSWSKMPPVSGAIYRASTGENKYAGASDSDNDYLAFDASRSNAIYGNSSTVQPQTIKVLHYMVVSK